MTNLPYGKNSTIFILKIQIKCFLFFKVSIYSLGLQVYKLHSNVGAHLIDQS